MEEKVKENEKVEESLSGMYVCIYERIREVLFF
jgi:hypothetical protein